MVVVENEERASPTPRMIGPFSRPAFRAVALSSSRASESGREEVMQAISSKYITRFTLETILKILQRLSDTKVLS